MREIEISDHKIMLFPVDGFVSLEMTIIVYNSCKQGCRIGF